MNLVHSTAKETCSLQSMETSAHIESEFTLIFNENTPLTVVYLRLEWKYFPLPRNLERREDMTWVLLKNYSPKPKCLELYQNLIEHLSQ